MSTSQDIPQPPEDATEREQELWKELINRINTLRVSGVDSLATNTENESEALDFNPELHVRDEEGKFAEKPGSGLGDVEDVFSDFGDESMRDDVNGLTRSWWSWPTDSNTKEMWTAAADITDNQNDPGDITGSPLVDEFDVDSDKVDSMKEFASFNEEKLREEYGDSVTAHRFIHGGEISEFESGSPEVVERLKNGDKVQPRTLGSWTTDKEIIPDIIEAVAPEADPEELEDAVVVTKEIPVENIMAHHETTPEISQAEQKEVVAMLDWSDDLSDNTAVETVTEVVG